MTIPNIGINYEEAVEYKNISFSGKTTILYKLELGEVVTTIPTIEINVEAVEYKMPGRNSTIC